MQSRQRPRSRRGLPLGYAVLADGAALQSFAVEGWTDTAPASVLGVRLWQFEAFGVDGRRSADVTVLCLGCGQRVAPALGADASAQCPACGAALRVIVWCRLTCPSSRLGSSLRPIRSPRGGQRLPLRPEGSGARAMTHGRVYIASHAAAALPRLEPRAAEVPPEERQRPARSIHASAAHRLGAAALHRSERETVAHATNAATTAALIRVLRPGARVARGPPPPLLPGQSGGMRPGHRAPRAGNTTQGRRGPAGGAARRPPGRRCGFRRRTSASGTSASIATTRPLPVERGINA